MRVKLETRIKEENAVHLKAAQQWLSLIIEFQHLLKNEREREKKREREGGNEL